MDNWGHSQVDGSYGPVPPGTSSFELSSPVPWSPTPEQALPSIEAVRGGSIVSSVAMGPPVSRPSGRGVEMTDREREQLFGILLKYQATYNIPNKKTQWWELVSDEFSRLIKRSYSATSAKRNVLFTLRGQYNEFKAVERSGEEGYEKSWVQHAKPWYDLLERIEVNEMENIKKQAAAEDRRASIDNIRASMTARLGKKTPIHEEMEASSSFGDEPLTFDIDDLPATPTRSYIDSDMTSNLSQPRAKSTRKRKAAALRDRDEVDSRLETVVLGLTDALASSQSVSSLAESQLSARAESRLVALENTCERLQEENSALRQELSSLRSLVDKLVVKML